MFCPALIVSFVMQDMQAKPDMQQSATSSFPAVCCGCAYVQMWPCSSGRGWYDATFLWRPFAFPYNVMANEFVPKKGWPQEDKATEVPTIRRLARERSSCHIGNRDDLANSQTCFEANDGPGRDGNLLHDKAPKIPMNAYQRFVREKRPMMTGKVGDVAKELFELWANMEPEAKMKYEDEAKKWPPEDAAAGTPTDHVCAEDRFLLHTGGHCGLPDSPTSSSASGDSETGHSSPQSNERSAEIQHSFMPARFFLNDEAWCIIRTASTSHWKIINSWLCNPYNDEDDTEREFDS